MVQVFLVGPDDSSAAADAKFATAAALEDSLVMEYFLVYYQLPGRVPRVSGGAYCLQNF